MTEKCEFKSAKELGLTPKEWEALIKTLVLMEAGAMTHVPSPYSAIEKIDGHLFKMVNWRDEYKCGTVCCIGGSAEVLGGMPRGRMDNASNRLAEEGNRNLNTLFFEWAGDPTPKQAAIALRGYLTTGETDWSFMNK